MEGKMSETPQVQLSPEARLLIQGHMLALVRPYGVFALAILGLIGSGFFWAIKTESTEAARKSAETEIEKKKPDFERLESDFLKLTNRVVSQSS